MRRRPDFLTKSSWVLCPVNAVKKIFSTNLSSESSSFNQSINELIDYLINILINLWPAYSTFVFPIERDEVSLKVISVLIINKGQHELPLSTLVGSCMLLGRWGANEGARTWPVSQGRNLKNRRARGAGTHTNHALSCLWLL